MKNIILILLVGLFISAQGQEVMTRKQNELNLLVKYSQVNYPGVYDTESIQKAEELDLSNSGIEIVVPALKYLPELKKLILTGNNLESVDLRNCKKLEYFEYLGKLDVLMYDNLIALSEIHVGKVKY